jgi:hypothetical protein
MTAPPGSDLAKLLDRVRGHLSPHPKQHPSARRLAGGVWEVSWVDDEHGVHVRYFYSTGKALSESAALRHIQRALGGVRR